MQWSVTNTKSQLPCSTCCLSCSEPASQSSQRNTPRWPLRAGCLSQTCTAELQPSATRRRSARPASVRRSPCSSANWCDQKRNQKTSSGQQHGRVQSRLVAIFKSVEQFFQRHVVVGVLELSVREPVHERDCDQRHADSRCSKRSSQRHNANSACDVPRLELGERRQQHELVRLEHQSKINRERKRLIHFVEQVSSLQSIACFAFEFAVAQTESQVHDCNQRDDSDQRKVVNKSAARQQSEVLQIAVLKSEVEPVGNCLDARDVFERHKVKRSRGRLEAGQVVNDRLWYVWVGEQQQ